jgi:hypothetical protein
LRYRLGLRHGDRTVVVRGLLDDRSYKAIAALRHRFDDLRATAFAKDTPQHRDVLSQVVFFHERIRPHELDELVFRDHTAVPFDQHQKSLNGFGSERGRVVPAEENLLNRIEAECPECVGPPG